MSRRNRNRHNGPAYQVRHSTEAEMTKAAVPGVGPGATVYTAQQVAALMAAGVAPQTSGGFNALPRLDPQVAFGPGLPVLPAAIDPVRRDTGRPEPRFTEYPVSINLPGVTDRLVPWKVLRDAAAAGGIPRRCIQIRKDEITTLEWTISITKDAVAKAGLASPSSSRADLEADLRKRLAPEIARCTAFWERPDPGQDEDWPDWIGKLLEEHLVLDAVCIYPRRTYGGDLYAMEVLDGSTIKILRDYRGGKPLPPNPSYQQMLWGFPRGEYIADVDEQGNVLNGYGPDTLIYKRRNVRTFTQYGHCYDDTTEVLTRDGWRLFRDLDGTEELATRGIDGAFEWQQPTELISKPYSGSMLHFRSQVFDLMVTPNHRMLVQRRHARKGVDETPELRPAAWFAEVPSRGCNWFMPTTSTWKGSAPEYVLIPEAEPMRGRHHRARELKIDPLTWVRFLGLFLSEGYVLSAAAQRNVVGIAQIKPDHKPFIEAVLSDLGVDWHVKKGSGYEFHHGPLAEYLRAACYVGGHRAWNKAIPSDVKEYPADLLRELFDALMRGDGNRAPTGLCRYTTSSPRLRDDVVEILQKCGSQGWHEKLKPGHSLAQRPAYRVIQRPGTTGRVPVPREVDYHGTVYCATVPNRTLYVRRNGRTAWCGNSAVEQCLEDLDVWLRRRAWIRAEYTDGSIPSGLLRNTGANSWTPQQVLEYETALNDAWSGQTLERHRMRILPPGFELESMADVAERYKPEYDLFLLKQLAAHFSTTIAELNFTEAGGLGSTGYHEGQADIKSRIATMPTYRWIQNLITSISRRHLQMPAELEFKILGLEDEDEAAADAVAEARVKSARMTYNEDRDRLGLPRYPFPEADMPIVQTSRGVIFLEGASQLAPAGETVQPLEGPAPKDANGDGIADSLEQSEGDEAGEDAGGGTDSRASEAQESDNRAEKAEIAAYRNWARKNRGTPRAFEARVLTKAQAPADMAADHRVTFAPEGGALVPKAGDPARPHWPGWDRDKQTAAVWAPRIRKAMRSAIDTRSLAEAWIASQLHTLTKADEPDIDDGFDDDPNQPDTYGQDPSSWLAENGVNVASALVGFMIGVWIEGYAIGYLSAAAVLRGDASVDWSRWIPGDFEAARLVLDENGRNGLTLLLEQAGVTINSITANRLDKLAKALAEALKNGDSADTLARALRGILDNPQWAEMVAITELARATSAASMNSYRANGIEATYWATAEDDRVCSPCEENEAQGAVPLGAAFPDGSISPPGHPICRCALLPSVVLPADIGPADLAGVDAENG